MNDDQLTDLATLHLAVAMDGDTLQLLPLLRAVADAARQQCADWQPIETAPRDGTKFIGARFCADESDPGHEVGWYQLITWDRYEPVDGGLFKKELDVVC